MAVKGLYRYLRLTYFFTQKAIKGMMAYRLSFLINCISQAMDYSVAFLLMWVMISAFEDMNGWSAYEVMLLYAFSLFAYGIAGTFFFNIMNLLPEQILRGTFDDVLVKPVKVLPYLVSSSFICNYIAHMALSVIVMAFCLKTLQIQVTVHFLWKSAGILLSGSLIYGGLFLIVSGSAFLVAKIDVLFQVMYFFREVSYYPVSIFPKIIQVIVTTLVPYGFVNYYPIRELLGKNDGAVFSQAAGLGPIVAALFFAVACFFFHQSTKCYKSSGS
ncbi:MAG: ABC-2 family transporter protein [Butyrivibrio sp.]|nr:ABC-2 family transporter protein [Butyrivibrio sp.]